MPISFARVAAVTAGLLALGAACGAVLGGLIMTALSLVLGRDEVGRHIAARAAVGAGIGAMIGGVLTPILAWIFLRRVPLGRAMLETTLGLLAGVMIAAVIFPPFWFFGALLGFVVAGVRLYVVTRPVHR